VHAAGGGLDPLRSAAKLMSAAGGGNKQPVDAVQLGRYATETFAA